MKGKIIKGIGGFYYVKTTDGLIECKARGKFRHRDMKPLVGDDVEIVVEHGKGVICDIHERKSELIRPTVANVTQAFVVFAIKTPDINYDLLNRFLVLCEHNNIKAIVCLNKVDLVSDDNGEVCIIGVPNNGKKVGDNTQAQGAYTIVETKPAKYHTFSNKKTIQLNLTTSIQAKTSNNTFTNYETEFDIFTYFIIPGSVPQPDVLLRIFREALVFQSFR